MFIYKCKSHLLRLLPNDCDTKPYKYVLKQQPRITTERACFFC